MNSLAHAVLLTLILARNLISSNAEVHNSENSTMESVTETTQKTTSSLTVLQQWEQMEKGLKTAVKKMISFALPRIMDSSRSINISMVCIKNVMKLIVGLRDTRTWAMRFLDSSAKGIDGVLSGSASSFGSFDECINTEVINERNERKYDEVLFRGKYCTLDIKTPLPPKSEPVRYQRFGRIPDELKNFSNRGTILSDQVRYIGLSERIPPRIGICIPSGCSEEDLAQILQQASNSMIMNITMNRCEIKEENQYSTLQIAILSLFGFMGLLVFIGTSVDFYISYTKQEYKDLPIRILLCFSFTKNLKQILTTKSSSSDNISCINGFRFLSMTWIIFGHTYILSNFHILREVQLSHQFAEDFAFQVLINTMLSVDTFFCIGGMVVSHSTMKNSKIANRPFSVPSYIFYRIFRILPPYLFVIAFVFLTPLMGSGPVWKDMMDATVEPCYRNWWRNVIFINNFFITNHKCVAHGWYVAADMQLYVAALVVLLPMLKWPKVGFAIAFTVIVSSIASSAVVSYVKNFPPAIFYYNIDIDLTRDVLNYLYCTAYGHAGPYFVGTIVGYFLATRPKIQIPKMVQIVGWLLAIACNMSVIYGIYGWSKGTEPTDWEVIFYSGCHRTAWSLGVSWVIFCCQTGHGGVVNRILCWKAWIPLGRLTYLAYLLHVIIQIIWMGSSKQGIQTSHASFIWMFFGYLVASYGTALAASVVIESPFLSLQKIIFGSTKRNETNSLENIIHEEKTGIDKDEDMIRVISISKKSSTDGRENA